MRRYILGSVVDSEKNYVDALKRILEVPEYLLAFYSFIVWKVISYIASTLGEASDPVCFLLSVSKILLAFTSCVKFMFV